MGPTRGLRAPPTLAWGRSRGERQPSPSGRGPFKEPLCGNPNPQSGRARRRREPRRQLLQAPPTSREHLARGSGRRSPRAGLDDQAPVSPAALSWPPAHPPPAGVVPGPGTGDAVWTGSGRRAASPSAASGTAPRRTGLARPSSGARGGWERAGGSRRCAAAQHPSCRRPRAAGLGADDVLGPRPPRPPEVHSVLRGSSVRSISRLSCLASGIEGGLSPKRVGATSGPAGERFLFPAERQAHGSGASSGIPLFPILFLKQVAFIYPPRLPCGSHFF